jgi:AraC-like DNA-binding protein
MAATAGVSNVCQCGLSPWQAKLAVALFLSESGSGRSVAAVAAQCGLSRSYFEKAFKVSLGTPPHRWLVRQRIQRAGDLLERSNDSIGSIALICGFTDQSHLSRVFRASVGSTPAAWRRERKAGAGRPDAGVATRPVHCEAVRNRNGRNRNNTLDQPDGGFPRRADLSDAASEAARAGGIPRPAADDTARPGPV